MKAKKFNTLIVLVLLAVSFLALELPALAQSATTDLRTTASVKTDNRILYHNGRVLTNVTDVYFVWYGCWDNTCGAAGDTTSQSIMMDFASNVGATPYFEIITTYPDGSGYTASGAVFLGGYVYDHYSRGTDLTATDIQGIIADQITSFRLRQDPNGIYVVFASADVRSPSTGLCVPGARPHHGIGMALGSDFRYAFVGNPTQCPSIAAPQFVSDGTLLPTPNGNFAGDAMASILANVLSSTITNPYGDGWYDRYSLQSADKCEGQFGQTYMTANGARANVRLGQRDYLIQENWVNERKGRCAMSLSQF